MRQRKTLPRKFYSRDVKEVAKALLGKILVHNTPEGVTKGVIVETEAYYGEKDPASHAYGGRRTKRNEVMWGPPGYAYVYFTYGMHYMLNVVTGTKDEAQAVLIRAVEPIDGIELMKKRREVSNLRTLTNGPAKVTQAFGITRKENGADLVNPAPLRRSGVNSNLRIEEGMKINFDIVSTTRIGIKAGKSMKLRFYIKNNKFVSRL